MQVRYKKRINNIKLRILALTVITILVLVGISIPIFKENKLFGKVEQKISKDNILNNDMNSNQVIEDKGIFGKYYDKAEQKLQTLTIEEKIAQMFIIGNSESTDYQNLKSYQFGGYLFFKDFFNDKTQEQIKNSIEDFQNASKIPLLIAVDEEGGKVVRVSSNSKLVPEPFKAPSEIYINGGLEAIEQDTVNKSKILNNLGINVNFAPVVDVASNPNDYMYNRALQQDKDITATYAETVINASKGLGVSYTLKHFPGYGNNKDTHVGGSVDTRTYEDIYNNDIEPFRAGIDAGAECVMVSHNIVTSIDPENQASISPQIHELLRKELNFKGVIVTDALNMGAIHDENTIEEAITKAIKAGNDMIILSMDINTTDKDGSKITYSRIIDAVKKAIDIKEISVDIIDEAVARILAWKYYKEITLLKDGKSLTK